MDALDELASVVHQAPVVRPAPQRVGFVARLGATVIDWIGILFGSLLVAAVSALVLYAIGQAGNLLVVASSVYLFQMLYWATEIRGGQTLGKFFLDLRVARPDAVAAGLQRLLIRWCVRRAPELLAGLVFMAHVSFDETGIALALSAGNALDVTARLAALILFLGCMLAMLPRRQALHDLIAGTAVYKANDVRGATAASKGFEVRAVLSPSSTGPGVFGDSRSGGAA